MIRSLSIRTGAVVCALLLGVFLLPRHSAASRTIPNFEPYADIVDRSTLVVMADFVSADFYAAKSGEAPPPPPAPTGSQEEQAPPIRPEASWRRVDFGGQPSVLGMRSELRVRSVFHGKAPAAPKITVDLLFGLDRQPMLDFWKSNYACVGDSPEGVTMVLHLRPSLDAATDQPRFELVTQPWFVAKQTLPGIEEGMRLRIKRYAAFKEIESLMSRLDKLTDEEFARLSRLVLSEDAEYGTVRWEPGELSAMNELRPRLANRETREEAIKMLWGWEKAGYIELATRTTVSALESGSAQRPK